MEGKEIGIALGSGIGIAILFSLMNGLSTYIFAGQTIMEKSVEMVGGVV